MWEGKWPCLKPYEWVWQENHFGLLLGTKMHKGFPNEGHFPSEWSLKGWSPFTLGNIKDPEPQSMQSQGSLTISFPDKSVRKCTLCQQIERLVFFLQICTFTINYVWLQNSWCRQCLWFTHASTIKFCLLSPNRYRLYIYVQKAITFRQ